MRFILFSISAFTLRHIQLYIEAHASVAPADFAITISLS